MSVNAGRVTAAPQFRRSAPAGSGELSAAARGRRRLLTFSALALYGAERWGTMLRPAPSERLLGLAALAVALAAAVPATRRYGRLPALALAVALCLLAFPVAGLQWNWFIHARIAVTARYVGDGLAGLPNAFVPYAGTSDAVRLVIMLGAAILLLDAAIVIGFAPAGFGDARRAGAALPLVALAVVPCTLVRPQHPYLQGLFLFALLAAFVWGERIRPAAVGPALYLAAAAGLVAVVVAPRLDLHKPLLNYRAWTGALIHRHLDAFDWNQTYGPLNWPHSGHPVLQVNATRADYWKAENLDVFNGYAWVAGATVPQPNLPEPSKRALATWTTTIRVTIRGMRTTDVISAGVALHPPAVPGGVRPGVDPGSFTAAQTMWPGTTYTVTSYSPDPTAAQLRTAGSDYPDRSLIDDLTLTIPRRGAPPQDFTQVPFPLFHTLGDPPPRGSRAWRAAHRGARLDAANRRIIAKLMRDSPYAGAYALAQRLARRSATPYAFVESVLRYLSHGYRYNQQPPVSTYPLASFLFKTKLGYCQQFSGAMALLLRMGGLPARIAAGFTSGTQQTPRGPFVVSDIDAHAWVEVWFPRYGWVRFDPTPAVAPARAEVSTAAAVSQLAKTGAPSPGALRAHGPVVRSGPGSAPRHSGGGVSGLLITAAVVALASLALLVRSLLRRTPTPDDLLDELERAMVRGGRPLGGGVTLAALEHRFRSAGASGYIRSLRLMRYGGDAREPTLRGRRALRKELRRDLGLGGRLRALWALPPALPAALARLRRGASPGGALNS
jgi:transglutaminase-like putative cysteine protease